MTHNNPPRTRMDRFKVLKKMAAHAQYTQSGDNTLEGIRRYIVGQDSNTILENHMEKRSCS